MLFIHVLLNVLVNCSRFTLSSFFLLKLHPASRKRFVVGSWNPGNQSVQSLGRDNSARLSRLSRQSGQGIRNIGVQECGIQIHPASV